MLGVKLMDKNKILASARILLPEALERAEE